VRIVYFSGVAPHPGVKVPLARLMFQLRCAFNNGDSGSPGT
jgi:hypothetical protein